MFLKIDQCQNFFESKMLKNVLTLKHSLIKPNELLDFLNNINPAIQFSMETSDTQHPFLDVMINKEGKKVFRDISSKPTD